MNGRVPTAAVVLWCLAALTAVPGNLRAQAVSGLVVEEQTRVPIADVSIEMVGSRGRVVASTATDSTGAFFLYVRNPGDYTLRLTHASYAPVEARLNDVRTRESMQLELRMARGAIPLDPLVVTAREQSPISGFYARLQRGGFGSFVTREEIDRRPAASAADLLRELPEIILVPVQPVGCFYCAYTYQIEMRSAGGTCSPTIYIDGVLMRQDRTLSIDTYLTANVVEGVEVYRGVYAPPPLVAQNQCGVVAYWTREDSRTPFTWRRIAIGAAIAASMLTVTGLLAR